MVPPRQPPAVVSPLLPPPQPRAELFPPHRSLPLPSCWIAWLCHLLQPRPAHCSLPRPQPQPRLSFPQLRRHLHCLPAMTPSPRCCSDPTHACAVAATPTAAISLCALTQAQRSFWDQPHACSIVSPRPPPCHPPLLWLQLWYSPVPVPSRCSCRPATADMPVPCHATSTATRSVHGTTAGECCSASHVSFRVSASGGA